MPSDTLNDLRAKTRIDDRSRNGAFPDSGYPHHRSS